MLNLISNIHNSGFCNILQIIKNIKNIKHTFIYNNIINLKKYYVLQNFYHNFLKSNFNINMNLKISNGGYFLIPKIFNKKKKSEVF